MEKEKNKPKINSSFISGKWSVNEDYEDIYSPFNGDLVSRVSLAKEKEVTEATKSAKIVLNKGSFPGHVRRDWLKKAAEITLKRSEDIANAISKETGKVISDTRAEVLRSCETLSLSADEAIRITGEHIPMDGSSIGSGKLAILLRYPIGLVAAIIPFNAPFNMACHKVGPALAGGNAVILKGPPEAPSSMTILAEILLEAGVPESWFSLLQGGSNIGKKLVEDQSVDYISFTGSTKVGMEIRKIAGMRGTTLELGGLGPNIVTEDADIKKVSKMCALNGMRLSGQSCVSVQNLFVHESIIEEFTERLSENVNNLKVGNPLDPEMDLGPMISEREAIRIESWVSEAVQKGATLITGGVRKGAIFFPTLLSDVTQDMKVVCEEAFGPVISIHKYKSINEPINWVNKSSFGLNCGLFTDSNSLVFEVARKMSCGGLIINGTSTFRPDQIPYGGLHSSGIGREGPSRAVNDMTEERLLIFNN